MENRRPYPVENTPYDIIYLLQISVLIDVHHLQYLPFIATGKCITWTAAPGPPAPPKF